ncbi:unnamed protein product [Merluccius merluccius]
MPSARPLVHFSRPDRDRIGTRTQRGGELTSSQLTNRTTKTGTRRRAAQPQTLNGAELNLMAVTSGFCSGLEAVPPSGEAELSTRNQELEVGRPGGPPVLEAARPEARPDWRRGESA